MLDLAATAASAAKALLPRLLEGAGGAVSKLIHAWNLQEGIARLGRVRYVKPIWNPGTEADLTDFYFPCPLESRGHERVASELADLPADHVLIRGRVGQGKSILLRFLASNELRSCLAGDSTARIPLLLELRHLGLTRGVREFAIETLSELGLECDAALFDHLAARDRLALLLDGFDELPSARRESAANDLERLATRYPKLKIVLTSRPYVSGVEHLSGFHVTNLLDLSDKTLEGVIRKQYSPEQQDTASALLHAIACHEVRHLAATPLMAVLLVIHYNTYQKIPEKANSFHEDLFDALLRRHDATKPGFVRQRLSRLDDLGMRSWFDRFAFQCIRSGTSSWNRHAALDFASRSLPARGQAAGADEVLADAVHITGLVVEEGGEYEFVHKSVAEYHAASCIKAFSEKNSRLFYGSVRSASSLYQWEEVLRFLAVIDRVRYLRYFEIAQLKSLIDSPSLATLFSDNLSFSGSTKKLTVRGSWVLNTAGAPANRLVAAVEAYLRTVAASLSYAVTGEAVISADMLLIAEDDPQIAARFQAVLTWCQKAFAGRQAEVEDLDDVDELLDGLAETS